MKNKSKNTYKFKIFLFSIIVFQLIKGNLIQPENGSTINTTHILFEWQQIQYANQYQLQLCYDDLFSNCLPILSSTSLMIIIKDGINWDSDYFWRIKPVFTNGSEGNWGNQSSFTTSSSIGNPHSIIIDQDKIQEGITIFGAFFDYYSAAIDNLGNEIWNSGNNNFVYYNFNSNGQLFGSLYRPELQNNLPGVHYSNQNKIIWEDPNDHFLHHEIFQLKNGNYIGIVEDESYGPIPPDACLEFELTGECNYATFFQNLGYMVDGQTVEFKWIGDRIVIWDQNTGEEIWSWSTFDHFNMNDFDKIGGSWTEASNNLQRYDWTHCNAFWFDEENNMIYLSSRHLSRITKISYPSGDIIWNMGLEMPSQEVNIGNEINFSYQHSLQILENGNIVTLDNGNLSEALLNTDYPTTRALEIEVVNDTIAHIIWEYNLPDSLFGFASGNVQKLDNGNYLITTVGDGGTSIEVTNEHQVVWNGKYNLTLPSGAVYRAHRIPGIYSNQFSLKLPENTNFNFYNTWIINEGYSFDFYLKNESDFKSIFDVFMQIDDITNSVFFESQIELDPLESTEISSILNMPSLSISDGNIHPITIIITPINNDQQKREYKMHLSEDDITASPRFVYPGDTDNNGIVNEYDILPIGIFFNQIGFNRDSISFDWNGHAGLKWNEESSTYADANGNGVIDAHDVIGIGVNWGNTHSVLEQTNPIDENLIFQNREAFIEIYNSLIGSSLAVDAMKNLLEDLLDFPKPSNFLLIQNFPNPFNGKTKITFSLPEKNKVSLTVTDISGKFVSILIDEKIFPAGESEINWNANHLPSGIYFYTFKSSNYINTQKMILIK